MIFANINVTECQGAESWNESDKISRSVAVSIHHISQRADSKCHCLTCQRHYYTAVQPVCVCVCELCARDINTFFPSREESRCSHKWKRRSRADLMELRKSDVVLPLQACRHHCCCC